MQGAKQHQSSTGHHSHPVVLGVKGYHAAKLHRNNNKMQSNQNLELHSSHFALHQQDIEEINENDHLRMIPTPSSESSNYHLKSVGSTPEPCLTGFFAHPCFDITLDKKDGSLGFTIHKKEDGFLYVKEVIKEPAILEPLMTPGDRILLVNGVNVSSLTHEGAILYLRGLPNRVTLKIQPVFPDDVMEDILDGDMSSEGYASLRKQSAGRKQLRPEALMMIKEKSGMNSLSRLRLRNKDKSSSRLTQQQSHVGCDDQDNQDCDSHNNNDSLVIKTPTFSSNKGSNDQHDNHNLSSHDMEKPAGVEEMTVESQDITAPRGTCLISSPSVLRIDSTNPFYSPPPPPPRTSRLSKNDVASPSSLLFSNRVEDNDQHNLHDSSSNNECIVKKSISQSSLTTSTTTESLTTVIPCSPLSDDDTSSLGNEKPTKLLVKSQSSDGFKSVVHVSSPSHVVVTLVDDNLTGKVKTTTRRSSQNRTMDTQEDSIVVSSKLSKWKGGNLSDQHYLQGIRDEQDSGFGDTITPKDTLEKPLRNFLEVTLEKGWTSRLGIQLMDDPTRTPPDYCVVKSIIDHTVASQDGRIKPGFKMMTVNGQSLEGKPAKEVIEFLRRVKGKVHMKFLIPSTTLS